MCTQAHNSSYKKNKKLMMDGHMRSSINVGRETVVQIKRTWGYSPDLHFSGLFTLAFICKSIPKCVYVCVLAPHPVCVAFVPSASRVQLFIRWNHSFSPCLLVLSSELLDPVHTATHIQAGVSRCTQPSAQIHTEIQKQTLKFWVTNS